MQRKIQDYIEKHQMIQEHDRIIAGVSGGADSICLFFILLELKQKMDMEFAVVHVNHMIRGEEADGDAAFVQELCKQHGIFCKMYSFPVKEIAAAEKLSLEEAGRKLRYQAFAEFAEQWGANKIALAHHQNDLAETMLYNMARGTGIGGLCSLRPVRNSLIRPLLCMNREEIEQYLEVRQLSYRTDSTNLELAYVRNKIRHKVVPQLTEEINGKAVEHMAVLSEDLEEIQDYLQVVTNALYQKYVRVEQEKMIVSSQLKEEAFLFQKYVIQKCMEEFAGTKKDFSRVHIQAVCELLTQGTGKCRNLPYGIVVRSNYGEVQFEKTTGSGEEKSSIYPQKINLCTVTEAGEYRLECSVFEKDEKRIPQKSYTKWIDYDKINTVLTLRNRQPGDYIVINENGGRKKLKDYFIDHKIPREERDRVLLVADGSEIVWIIGYRLSHNYMVRGGTKTILQMQIKGGSIHE